jgi:hypothetical protein
MTTLNKKLLLFCAAICTYSFSYGQLEVARLQSKDFNAFGLGSFINFGVPVTESGTISLEGGFIYFTTIDQNAVIAPVIAGYRKVLGEENFGWYVEPMVGYTFGGSDIQKTDANGYGLTKPNGDQIDQDMNGPTACINFGYLFEPGRHVQFNINLRYEHVFVPGDPALNLISLRVSHAILFGKRN